MVDLVNHPLKSIFRDGGLNKTTSKNHLFPEMVDINICLEIVFLGVVFL
jgi:hypothetical protein